MDEYIKRSDALNASKIAYIEYIEVDGEGDEDGNADEIPVVFKHDIEAIPAADVVPVVLCRDCVYANKWYADRLICYFWNEDDGNAVFEDGFCNYGKKREES